MNAKQHPENRLLTMQEIFVRYPKAFFNELGELVYNKRRNYYITPTYFRFLGTKTKGWRGDLYLFPFDSED